MDDSPRKQKSTSKVIDSLHSQIDSLKHEMEVIKISCSDYKKKSNILASKNDSLVDQLANCKHENDMVNALLKRKERRIVDLESEFGDLSSESESAKLAMKNYKIRCENLENSSASSTAEFERLKISYDALMASQHEYKRHYQEELTKLTTQFETFKSDSARAMNDLLSKLDRNDKDVDALLEGLNLKRTSMDNMIVDRNKSILGLLSLLAKVAKTHGEECKSILSDNVDIINVLREKIPEVFEKVDERTETTIDLDDLLRESAVSLETNFVDLDVKASGEISRQASRTVSSQGRKKNRNSLRLSPETSISDSQPQTNLPRQRAGSKGQPMRNSNSENGNSGVHRQPSKRNSSHGQPHNHNSKNNSTSRQSSNGSQGNPHRGSNNSHTRSSSNGNINTATQKTNNANGQNKNNKRRSLYGVPTPSI
ncbi:hypothetical protein JCM33374_g5625 [Metschnikowia sp. JCM 33374]|nr:hypothetical protein JCM33374_g5625 [Metschnikowia sp. JCM 33374]